MCGLRACLCVAVTNASIYSEVCHFLVGFCALFMGVQGGHKMSGAARCCEYESVSVSNECVRRPLEKRSFLGDINMRECEHDIRRSAH